MKLICEVCGNDSPNLNVSREFQNELELNWCPICSECFHKNKDIFKDMKENLEKGI